MRLVGPIARGVLVAGIAVAAWQWQRPPGVVTPKEPSPSAAPIAELDSIDDTAVEQALRQEPGNASDEKDRWVPVVVGVEIDLLSPKQRDLFVRFANAQRCTCGCGYTLAGCRTYDPSCEISYPILVGLRDSISNGLIASTRGL